MEKLTAEINKAFGKEFDFLRILEVVYSKSENECKLLFLYPESVSEITQEQRERLHEFLTKFLNLNAKIDLKFKKSFLDDELIINFILDYFKANNYSLFIAATNQNVSVKKHLAEIIVTLSFEPAILDYIQNNDIIESLKKQLSKNFIAQFLLQVKQGENQIDEDVLSQRQKLIKLPALNQIPRYQVFEPAKLFGTEIEPFPEFISQQKSERLSVILAGEVSNFNKKSYTAKFGKNAGEEKFFFTFDINDGTGTIPAIHFAKKSTLKKVQAIADGMHFLFLGDLKNNTFGKLTYYIKAASLVVFKKQAVEQAQQNHEKQEFLRHDTYQTIFPQPFVDTYQINLFEKRKFDPLIENNTIVVFDLETTGLEPEFAEIIEIGAVKVVNGELVETFETLVKPKKSISSIITNITGITDDMVKDSPTIEQVMSDFILFTKGAVLSGYNVDFDMRFLQKAANDMGFRFNNRVEDTMRFAREKLKLGNYTLKNVAKSLNIPLNNAHRAWYDAVATARALLELNKIV